MAFRSATSVVLGNYGRYAALLSVRRKEWIRLYRRHGGKRAPARQGHEVPAGKVCCRPRPAERRRRNHVTSAVLCHNVSSDSERKKNVARSTLAYTSDCAGAIV